VDSADFLHQVRNTAFNGVIVGNAGQGDYSPVHLGMDARTQFPDAAGNEVSQFDFLGSGICFIGHIKPPGGDAGIEGHPGEMGTVQFQGKSRPNSRVSFPLFSASFFFGVGRFGIVHHGSAVIAASPLVPVKMLVKKATQKRAKGQSQDQALPKGAAKATTVHAAPAGVACATFTPALRLKAFDRFETEFFIGDDAFLFLL
jgi:hypothetical protein